ncbi:helix-turn-helix domain-containing protein [Rhodococcus sp. IEGM 1408]|uniref:helix-turn-helix domain-containing protein n=1 Tax=Rhodococcus sp. IEGM 1408 TaxID=3082220 RepID=UPI0029531E78|nr:GAF domain-containing protein [Rhodococcus sp. IEGM 1408]MDV8002027.1 transcriptional regulator [Rhodococcus sp. IEGM 1408]
MSGGTGTATNALVAESWERSRRRGIDPAAADLLVDLQGAELASRLAAHPMAAVLPLVEKVLVSGVVDSNHLVAVADESGRLLWLYGNRGVRSRAERMAFVPGALWSDDAVGANAPGLALRHDVPVRVRGEEHYLAPAHAWSCSAAPVHDPVTGQVIGGIDVTGRDSAASDEMFALVRATALLAEAELRSARAGVLVSGVDGNAGGSAGGGSSIARLLAALGTLRPTLTGHGPLTRRHAEILVLLAAHPGGLSGGLLAELLAEGRLDEVSVRAELSRLRRVLGPESLHSRPYRLAPGLISTDAAAVSALLGSDVAAAVAAYPGRLLPASDAPGVVDLREELHARVRGAVLSADSVDALRDWVAGPGRDDAGAWRALAATPDAPPAARSTAAFMRRVLDNRLGA